MVQEVGKKLVEGTFLGAIGYGLATACKSSIIALQGSKLSYIYKAPTVLETLQDINPLFVATTCVSFSIVDGIARSIIDEIFPDQCNDSTWVLSRVTISVLTAAGVVSLMGGMPSIAIASGYVGASIAVFAMMKNAALAMQ
ncbi:MAG: hypothetical protein Q8K75_12675 [Chlamydiales bacterium]|nr:hypothetical protein [Chlamydiales bacterium]